MVVATGAVTQRRLELSVLRGAGTVTQTCSSTLADCSLVLAWALRLSRSNSRIASRSSAMLFSRVCRTVDVALSLELSSDTYVVRDRYWRHRIRANYDINQVGTRDNMNWQHALD